VDRLQNEYAIKIVYRHFPLHPDTPDSGLKLEDLFAGRNVDIASVQARLSGLMADEGLPYGERSMTYNSRLAQELARWAVTQPDGEAIHEALFKAYFVDNINLAEVEQLVSIAKQVGLPEEESRAVLLERKYQDAVDGDWQHARELGITGVPTFVIGNQGAVGAQPYEQLQAFVESSGAVRRSTLT
jgi:predicted DsbA family dithiol-disulfide isomerase